MWAKIITIKRTKDLNYFSLCALNLFNTQVSQFELNNWNKWTFPQHSNLLRCTCICRIRKEWSCIWWIWGGTTMGFTSYSPSDSHIHRKQLDPWEIIFNFSQHTMITAKYAKTHIRQHISIGNTKTWEQEPYGCDIMVHSATWPVCVCVCGVCVWCVGGVVCGVCVPGSWPLCASSWSQVFLPLSCSVKHTQNDDQPDTWSKSKSISYT